MTDIILMLDIILFSIKMKQRTVADVVKFSGVGCHLGIVSEVKIKPSFDGSGIKFKRTDVGEIIEAHYKNVSDTHFCTVISNKNGTTVSTIEHLMSALRALDIDNAIIEVNAPELPIFDGSAAEYFYKLKECGVEHLRNPKRYVKVLRSVSVESGDKKITLHPSESFSISATIDFDHPAIGMQTMDYNLDTFSYFKDIASARTFALMSDVEKLRKIGLAKGASLQTGIGLSENGILNEEGLRFTDEFIRHKILDCIGDCALGGNILGHVEAYKMGHHLNNLILHELFSDAANYEITFAKQQRKAQHTAGAVGRLAGAF